MKTLQIKRLALFCNIDRWTWLGYSVAKDGHNIIGSICFLTLEFGFEYVWKNFEENGKRKKYFWNLAKI
jgi:hypothetical protein